MGKRRPDTLRAIMLMGRLGTVIAAVFVDGMAAFAALFLADRPACPWRGSCPSCPSSPPAPRCPPGVLLRRREISRWSGF
jgi:hypothetical protein